MNSVKKYVAEFIGRSCQFSSLAAPLVGGVLAALVYEFLAGKEE